MFSPKNLLIHLFYALIVVGHFYQTKPRRQRNDRSRFLGCLAFYSRFYLYTNHGLGLLHRRIAKTGNSFGLFPVFFILCEVVQIHLPNLLSFLDESPNNRFSGQSLAIVQCQLE